MKYYELEDDLYFESRWHLCRLYDNEGMEFDSREFTYGNRMDLGPPLKCYKWNEDAIVDIKPPLKLTWSREGTPLDFTYTDSVMPVVTEEVAQLLSEFTNNNIQRFSVKVDRMEEEYEIINVLSLADCIDTEGSAIEWWEEGNNIRPDLAGKPHVISNLVIDPTHVGDHHIFRLQEWTLPVIVSEDIKRAFEEARVTGVRFIEV